MKTLRDFRQLCKKRLANNLGSYLQDPLAVEIQMGLRPPTEAEAIADMEAVKGWIAKLKQDAAKEPALTIKWQEKRWKRMGTQELPVRISISGLDNVAKFCLWQKELNYLRNCAFDLTKLADNTQKVASNEALELVTRLSNTLLKLSHTDWMRALDMAAWLIEQKSWNIYARTIPVAGLDTKWLETHLSLVQSICAYVDEIHNCDVRSFDFKKADALFQLRFLDATFAPKTASNLPLLNLALSTSDIDRLYTAEDTLPYVLILENKASFLALPELPHCVAIWGEGFKVSGLREIKWLSKTAIFYWGDIDCAGFSILSSLRAAMPEANIVSTMMDKESYLSFKDLAIPDPSGMNPNLGTYLLPQEKSCLSLIRSHGVTPMRLEQERIAWDYVLQHISSALRSIKQTS